MKLKSLVPKKIRNFLFKDLEIIVFEFQYSIEINQSNREFPFGIAVKTDTIQQKQQTEALVCTLMKTVTIEHSENRIVMQFELFKNEIGPGVIQFSVQKTDCVSILSLLCEILPSLSKYIMILFS